jgi:hypothetical protein
MESIAQYLLYFLVGGGATALIAYFNVHGNPGVAALIGCTPVHFLTNVLIAFFVMGTATAMSFSRTSIVTNFAWVGAVLVFALLLEKTGNVWIAILGCAVSGIVFNLMMNEVFKFV